MEHAVEGQGILCFARELQIDLLPGPQRTLDDSARSTDIYASGAGGDGHDQLRVHRGTGGTQIRDG
ncbi:hypothetical protein ACQCSX_02495 [Pseudarthrobacter sp. P1]|uniref:hypothetical protein n=1 Tax=Pseudarthrobacter sp. P1 TaxID=3418418 RepID=UPI003CF83B88